MTRPEAARLLAGTFFVGTLLAGCAQQGGATAVRAVTPPVGAVAATSVGTSATPSPTSAARPAYAHSSPASRGGRSASATGAPAASSGASHTTPPASGGRSSRGGGSHGVSGGTTPPAVVRAGLPADWPASVPVPAGTILGASGVSPQWSVNLLVPGPEPTVIARVVALYTAHGFTADPHANIPRILTKGALTVTVYWRAHDHSGESTEVLISLVKH